MRQVPNLKRRKTLKKIFGLQTIPYRLSSISNWRLKGLVVALLCITALLGFAQVRATSPPVVGLAHMSTLYGPVAALTCSGTTGGDTQVGGSTTVAIPSGHTYFFQAPTFTGAFNVSSTTNPTYNVEFYVNGTSYGTVKGFTSSNKTPISASFTEPMSTFTIWDFYYTGQAGPQHLVWTVDISTASGQSVCVQQWQLVLNFAYT